LKEEEDTTDRVGTTGPTEIEAETEAMVTETQETEEAMVHEEETRELIRDTAPTAGAEVHQREEEEAEAPVPAEADDPLNLVHIIIYSIINLYAVSSHQVAGYSMGII
jgi:hypothetical protein